MIPSRRARITAIIEVALAAKETGDRIRAGDPAQLPLDLANAVEAFLHAADAVQQIAESEARPLEEARDVCGDSP